MSKVLSLQNVELRPDADEHEFQRVVFDEVTPLYRSMGWTVRLLKGDRGAREGKYLLIFEVQSQAERDSWVPATGILSDEAQKVFATSGPIWEKIERLTTSFLDPAFTDYVMINEW